MKRRRVLIAALDGGDVAEPEHLAVRLHRHGGDGVGAGEGAGHAQMDAVGGGVDRAAGGDGILPGDAVEDLLRGDAERGELGVAELDEDPLRAASPMRSTLLTSGTRSRRWRMSSAALLQVGERQRRRRSACRAPNRRRRTRR